MIRKIIKILIILSVVLVGFSFLGPSPQNNIYNAEQSPSMMNTIYAIKDILGDFGGFCDRNNESCDTIKTYIASFFARVKEGAMLAYKYIFETFTSNMQNALSLPQDLPPIIKPIINAQHV